MAPSVLEWDLGPGVRAFFTTRAGGVSRPPYDSLNLGLGVADEAAAVLANRRRVEALVGLPVAFGTQVHGADVVTVATAEQARGRTVGEADALVTASDDLALGVLVADCVPVLLAGRRDGASPVLGTAHAGRAGVVAGVVPAAVAAVRSAGGGEVRAVVGPAICGRCYEVPAEMRDDVAAAHPVAYATTSWGTPSLDLPAAVVAQLEAAGVEVARVPLCTHEDASLFSYRRDGTTGRCAGVIATRRDTLRHARAALV